MYVHLGFVTKTVWPGEVLRKKNRDLLIHNRRIQSIYAIFHHQRRVH